MRDCIARGRVWRGPKQIARRAKGEGWLLAVDDSKRDERKVDDMLMRNAVQAAPDADGADDKPTLAELLAKAQPEGPDGVQVIKIVLTIVDPGIGN